MLHACRRHNLQVDDQEVEFLAHGDTSFEVGGCLRGCFLSAFVKTALYVVRKVFTKLFKDILFFLMIRDALNGFAKAFHEGYLLRHGLTLSVIESPSGSQVPSPTVAALDPSVVRLRRAMETAYTGLDHGPITQIVRTAFAGSRGMLKHAGRSITRLLRRLRRREASDATVEEQLRQESEAELGGLIDSLTREISRETQYLGRMEQLLEWALGLGPTARFEESGDGS